MKKFVFALAVLLLAAPTWATTVSCTVDGCDVTVHYAGAGAGPVRGMAFNISIDGDGEISEVQCLSAAYGYQIFPGSISIDSSGNVDDWGSCKCDGGYPGTEDSAQAMTIEMASLYEEGVDPDPCDAGDLVSFRVINLTVDANVVIEVNPIRGGVVNEDASVEESPTLTGCLVEAPIPDECMKTSHPAYADWDALGKPDCWCYARQCKGDADGIQQFGLFWVYTGDLNIFKAAFAQTVLPAGGECADYAHDLQFGLFRVYTSDLNILKVNFAQTGLAECDMTDFNFWITP
jgi:hypothetical protein